MYEGRIKQIAADYRDKGVALVAIQPNGLIGYSERSHDDLGDSPEEMKIRAEYRDFNFPYLYDGETQAVARQYGPIATPHLYVFDQQRILRLYRPIAVRLKVEQNQLVGIFAEFVLGVGWLERL